MLNAILTALSPKQATQASAAPKPGADPAAARFDDVYGKTQTSADRRNGDPGKGTAERDRAADKPAPETERPVTPPAQSEPYPTSVAGESVPPVLKGTEEPNEVIELLDETVTVENDAEPEIAGTQPAARSEPAIELKQTPEQKAATLEMGHLRPAAPESPRHVTEPAEDLSLDNRGAARIVATAGSGDTDTSDGHGDKPRRDPVAASSSDVEETPTDPRNERTARSSGAFETAAPATRGIDTPQPRAADVVPPTAPAADPAPVGGTGTGSAAQSAAQTPALTVTAAGAPPTLIEQLAVAVKQSGDGRVDLTLSPVELGRVRLTLLTGETGITVAIRADRDDTLDLFRRNSDALAQEFRQMGYGSVGFDFGGGNRPGQPQARDAETDANTPDGPTAPLPVGILRLTGLGGLDIRI